MPEPTAEALEHLMQTHQKGCLTLRQRNLVPESFEVAFEVERHRWFWKPKQTKLILVAESHVLTTGRDREFRVDADVIRSFQGSKASLPPDRFVRLVYCLAYGESDLLHAPKPPQIENAGTPTYWDIFGRVTFRCPQPRREDGAVFDQRMRWKVDTLRAMHKIGIWLLDASVHAIFLGRGARLEREIPKSLHQQRWDGYGRHVVDSCREAKIWVIGKTVFDCLSNRRDWRCDGWVYQPNVANFLSNASKNLNHNWPQLLEDCWSLRAESKTWKPVQRD
jgi:hypothetical protein